MALINNPLYKEDKDDEDPDAAEESSHPYNDPSDYKQHPRYKTNMCKVCYNHRTVNYCVACSDPKPPKLRVDKDKNGGDKFTEPGYMHFCKHGGCFEKHDSGNVPKRRKNGVFNAGPAAAYC